MRDRTLVAAFGISLLAHVAILGTTGGPGSLSNPPAAEVLDARLVAVRVAAADGPAPEPVAVPPAKSPPRKVVPKPRIPRAPARSVESAANSVQAALPSDTSSPAADGEALADVPADAVADPAETGAPSPEQAPVGDAPGALAEQVAVPVDEALDEGGLIETAASGDGRRPTLAGWPDHGSIRFRVILGERGFVVGEARHEWMHDATRYRMSASLRTTGVVELFRSLQYAQRSEGRVGRKGLIPEKFSVEQSGKSPESAEFDWKGGQVTMRRGTRVRVAKVQAGDQDLLSLWHQIGIVGTAGLPLKLNVVSGKAATPSVLERLGEETVSMPIGRLDTVRLGARALDGKLSIEIWLARNYGMLPVRIRVVDDKGEVLDQQAIELRLAPPTNRTTADSGAETEDQKQAAAAEMIELRAEEESAAHLTIGN